MLRHADRDGGRHERADFFSDAARDRLGGERVGADQDGRPVLLGLADRPDDAGPGLEILLDELQGIELKLHGMLLSRLLRSCRLGFTQSALAVDGEDA